MRCLILFLAGTMAAAADPGTLRSHRLAGDSYITVGEITEYYRLTRGRLVAQADRREITLDGVRHWLGAPVLSARGKLWITSRDVLKTIDPVLRQGRSPTRRPVRLVVLDPGHGGSDTGARGTRGVEKQLTLDLSRRVAKQLEAAGQQVALTRTTDRALSLEQRVELAKAKRADLFVSIHFNAGGSAAAGIETYCVPPAGSGSTAAAHARGGATVAGNRHDEKNVWLAHCVQRALLRATGAADRGVRRARFVVIRDAPCPAILVEAGFLSHRTEEQRILDPAYREKLAKAIADGILEYKRTTE